jgi:hypothetical protein
MTKKELIERSKIVHGDKYCYDKVQEELKANDEIMLERGIYRIYDCGTMVWKWIKNVKT